jgi:hypothetical protein
VSTHLERLAQTVESDPFFLAAPLRYYADSQQLDDDALAGQLGCDRDTLTRLRLCRNPQPMPPHFWDDVDRIATRFQIDPDRLAEMVRLGQALLQAQPRAGGSVPGPGFLLAAREEPENEPPGGEEP